MSEAQARQWVGVLSQKMRMECSVFHCKKGYEYDHTCCCFCEWVDCKHRCLNDYRVCGLSVEAIGAQQAWAKRPNRRLSGVNKEGDNLE